MTFAERLKKLRAEKGYSQAELGKLINVSAATVCNYENGKIKPFINTQIQLASVLGISKEELMKEDAGNEK